MKNNLKASHDKSLFDRLDHWFEEHPRKTTLVALIGYFLVASLLTFPFIIHPRTTLTAPLAGDVSNSVTVFAALKREHKNPFFDGYLKTVAAPTGIPVNVAVNRVSALSTAFLWVLTVLFSALIANSLLTFSGYVLTGFVTFLFVRRITKSALIAGFAGLMYSCFPLFISLARAAPIYTHMWMYLLPIWAFWELSNGHLDKKRMVLAGLSIVPALFWTPYYTFHILLVGGAALGASLFLLRRTHQVKTLLQIFAPILILWLGLLVLYMVVGSSSTIGGAPSRSVQDAYEQAADPLTYLLPGAFTWWAHHGLQTIIASINQKSLTTNIYLGISTVLLAMVGFWTSTWHRHASQFDDFGKSQYTVTVIACTVAATCFLFSLPPTINIANLHIPTPDKFIVAVEPALRAGQRLAMPLMASLIILAALGIRRVLTWAPYRYTSVVFCVLILVVSFDLSAKPPSLTSTIPQSPAIAQLSHAPYGLTAEYIHSSVGDPGQIACQLQLQHHLPIVNDCGIKPGTDPHYITPLLQKVGNAPSICQQANVLQTNGVRYVIIPRTEWDKVVSCYSSRFPLTFKDNNFWIYKLN